MEGRAEAAARAAEGLERLVGRALAEGGRIVDQVGDAAFFCLPQPRAAVETVRRLFRAAADEPDFPALRCGLHHGRVLERGGRLYGHDVNLAARVAARAGGGQVLATHAVAAEAARMGVPVHPLGTFAFRNVRTAVPIFRLDVTPELQPLATDPVCLMQVDPATAPARMRHGEREYSFCSLACARQFAADPELFTARPDA